MEIDMKLYGNSLKLYENCMKIGMKLYEIIWK